MKTLLVNDDDLVKALQLLQENGIQAKSEEGETTIPLLRQSNATPGETPASFAGIWTTDKRTMTSIRAKAWPKRR